MRGYTLIEIAITTAVLTTGLAAVASIFSYSAGATARTRQRTAAALLLQEKMEELKAASGIESGEDSIHTGGVMYKRTWEVTGDRLRRITVVVYSPAGKELIRAATLKADDF